MGKVSIMQLAEVLKQRGLNAAEATAVVDTAFDIIREALQHDDQVKIKGLGTFKIVGVGARQSVDVNTGERIVIGGHEKITFTPDAVMREMVNKPFSQFDTVILNEGVSFDVAPDSPPPQDPPKVTEPTAHPDLTETPVASEAPTLTPSENNTTIISTMENNGFEEKPRSYKWLAWLLLLLAASGGAYYFGYREAKTDVKPEYIVANTAKVRPDDIPAQEVEKPADEVPQEAEVETEKKEQPQEEPAQQEPAKPAPSKPEPAKPAPSKPEPVKPAPAKPEPAKPEPVKPASAKPAPTKPAPSKPEPAKPAPAKPEPAKPAPAKPEPAKTTPVKQEPAKQTPVKQLTAKQTPAKTPTKKAKAKAVQEEESIGDSYEQADSRVRTGSYRIVGTDRVVTVRRGETLERIARRELGNSNMVCYLSAFNGIDDDYPIYEGMQIKIPKLKWRVKSK